MVRTRWSILALGLALAVLASCDSAPRQPDRGRPPPDAGREDPDGVETVTVPRVCVDQIADFFNRKQLVLGDRIVIDASAESFLPVVSFAANRRAVEQTEEVDTARKINIIRLRNISGQENLESVLPKVRFGDGFEIVATREILVRFHRRVRASRPIFFDMSADGRVLWSDTHRGEPVRRGHLELHIEVIRVDGGYKFALRAD